MRYIRFHHPAFALLVTIPTVTEQTELLMFMCSVVWYCCRWTNVGRKIATKLTINQQLRFGNVSVATMLLCSMWRCTL